MELPGVDVRNINVAVQDGNLVVTGEKKFEQEETGKSYFFSEREYGVFQRVFRIPPDAQQRGIEASYRNGVLSIRIPKARAEAGPLSNIEIKSYEN